MSAPISHPAPRATASNSMEVWATLPFVLHRPLFNMWVNGTSAFYASKMRDDRGDFPDTIIDQDTEDHFRDFESLRWYLMAPSRLWVEANDQLSPSDCEYMLSTYYAFDDRFMLEVAGKSLDRKVGSQLDEIHTSLAIPYPSCLRQFNNLKNIAKLVEDLPGRLAERICEKTRLSPAMSGAYAALVFMSENRISVEKSNLKNIPLPIFLQCTQDMMANWTMCSELSKSTDDREKGDHEFERRFLKELHDLRVTCAIEEVLAANPAWSAPPLLVRAVLLDILRLGSGLAHSKELRDIFEDLVDKICDPCRQHGLSAAQVGRLFDELEAAFVATAARASAGDLKELLPCVKRFIQGLKPCAMRLHAFVAIVVKAAK